MYIEVNYIPGIYYIFIFYNIYLGIIYIIYWVYIIYMWGHNQIIDAEVDGGNGCCTGPEQVCLHGTIDQPECIEMLERMYFTDPGFWRRTATSEAVKFAFSTTWKSNGIQHRRENAT